MRPSAAWKESLGLFPLCRENGSDWPFVIILLFAATALNVYSLTAKSLWMDEGFSVFMAQTDLARFWHTVQAGEINMLVYYGGLRLWMHISHAEYWVRLFSALSATASVPVVYAIGKRLLGRPPAFAAALLFALHPSEVTYAQELRSYSLAVLLVSLSCLFFLRFLDRPSTFDCIVYVFCSALAPYTHVFAILILIMQWAWLVCFFPKSLHRRDVKAACALLGASQIPLAWVVVNGYRTALNWVTPANTARVLEVWSFLTLPGWRGLLYVGAWLAALALLRRPEDQAVRARLAFVLCWLFIPFLLAAAFSLHKPVLVDRFLLVSLPASALLAAAGISRLFKPVAVFALLVLGFLSFNSTLSYYRHLRTHEDWRAATTYVLAHARPNDEVVVIPTYAQLTFDYYRNLASFGPVLVYGDFEATHRLAATSERTWLVVRDLPLLAGEEALLQGLPSASIDGRLVLETQRFNFIRVILLSRSVSPLK